MSYPVIDPVGTGNNIRNLVRSSGYTIMNVCDFLGISNVSTVYKWLRGDTLPGIDNLLALSVFLGVTVNDILAVR